MRPPQHSIDAPSVLVLRDDEAWDRDRIDSELEGLTAEEYELHPYRQYESGATRWDLNAKSTWKGGTAAAAEYLGANAIRFVLRRHTSAQVFEISDAVQREVTGDSRAAFGVIWHKSASYGLKEVQGTDDLAFNLSPGSAPERILRRILDYYGGSDAIEQIGLAAHLISKPLSEAEGKR